MKSGTIEDFMDYSDQKLKQFPAYSEPIDIHIALTNLSVELKTIYSDGSMPHLDYLRVSGIFKEVKDIETEYLNRKSSEYAETIKKTEGSGLEDSVQTSKSRADDPARIRSPGFRSIFRGELRLQEAEHRMQEGFRSLKRAKSKSPVLHYADDLDKSELLNLYAKNSLYFRKIGKEIEVLDHSNELFRDILYSEKDPNIIREAEKNLYKTEIHRRFEKGCSAEAHKAFEFLLESSEQGDYFDPHKYHSMLFLLESSEQGDYFDPRHHHPVTRLLESSNETPKKMEESIPDQKNLIEHLVIYSLMHDSVFLQKSKKLFEDTIVAIDDAVSLGYHDVIPEGYRARSEESIRRIEDRILHLDGIIALKGLEWALSRLPDAE